MLLTSKLSPYLVSHNLFLDFSKDFLFNENDQTFTVELPYPIHTPLKRTKVDQCKKLIRDKAEYNEKLKAAKQRYLKKTRRNSKKVVMPRGLLEFYFSQDPDEHFSSDFNFYYAGGFLDKVILNNSEFLVRVNSENFLCLNEVHDSENKVLVLDFKAQSPVLSIYSVIENKNSLLAVREKYTLTVLNLKCTTELEVLWTIDSVNGAFLDAKINSFNTSHVGMITINKKELCVSNIHSRKTIYSCKFNKSKVVSELRQFEFLNEYELLFMEEYKVMLINYDLDEIVRVFEPHLNDCNILYMFRVIENNLLLASQHYVMRTDIRYFEEPTYFSHTMKKPPCLMDVFQKDNNTYLVLASHSQEEEKILFTGNTLFSIPYLIPSVQKTLSNAQLKCEDLVFIRNLEERLNYSNVGLKILEVDGEIFIYSCNILGEIFRQKVTSSDLINSENQDEPVQKLHQWIKELKVPKAKLYITAIADMSGARFILNQQPMTKHSAKYEGVGEKASQFLGKNLPIYSKHATVSGLAAGFMSLWEDDKASPVDTKNDALPEVPFHEKVSSWMEKHLFDDNDEEH